MSVVIETTIGDITVDLFLTERPRAALNFLKLCKLKYYNFNLFHTIQHGFIAQTGDPGGSGDGGSSIWGVLEGKHKRYFEGEAVPKIKHIEPGLLSMVCAGEGLVGSQFFFTLGPDLASLDSGGHVVIGEVTEGHEVLRKLNEVICDEKNRPYQDVRITHTVVLEDPFDDPRGFREPSRSPSPSAERLAGGRIAADEEIDDTDGKTAEEVAEMLAEKEAKARATILEIVGDIPDADIAPPENVLFVCKLNPVTTDDDLQIIFSRFGKIKGCEVIRDKVSGDSLQYAFIEFEDKKSCEDAYFKMDNVLIDDRRIHVDFSQSVSKVRWKGKGKGIEYFDGTDSKSFKDIQSSRQDRKRAPSRLRKSVSSGSSSKSRSPSPKRRPRSPRGLKGGGGGRRVRSPWRRSGGGGGGGERRRRDNRVRLSESNSAYHEERNGRDIRVVQGMVDYKNRPYPTSFIKRNASKPEEGTSRPLPQRGRRSRSPVRNRQQRRSKSNERRRLSRSRSRSSSYRRKSSSEHGRRGRDQDRRRMSRSPVQSRIRRRASASRSPERKTVRSHRRSVSPDQRDRVDRNRNRRDISPAPRRLPSPKSKGKPKLAERDERKKSKKKRHASASDRSTSEVSSDDHSKSKKKKKTSKKKSKKSDKRYSSSASSDSGSDSSDGGKRKKRKNKSKKNKNFN
ncbi:peptidyl-prolyl cis-trans isomerase sig-7 [Wyeomyia smithii]|uniref:peptidyl-prolyl cis-trans isomerase sig-7 n=1 Tax=Wyeomyia smithii TaxID=174621 RepID=UPI002467D7A8|nr:peptidyl-prolyl cis-trans isomerase sig-7 [Wyeomyia smithii]XP_055545913.1 peptidyl-prolyl cis-trans isomerase sig-7 [Wyeomyia smithii]